MRDTACACLFPLDVGMSRLVLRCMAWQQRAGCTSLHQGITATERSSRQRMGAAGDGAWSGSILLSSSAGVLITSYGPFETRSKWSLRWVKAKPLMFGSLNHIRSTAKRGRKREETVCERERNIHPRLWKRRGMLGVWNFGEKRHGGGYADGLSMG